MVRADERRTRSEDRGESGAAKGFRNHLVGSAVGRQQEPTGKTAFASAKENARSMDAVTNQIAPPGAPNGIENGHQYQRIGPDKLPLALGILLHVVQVAGALVLRFQNCEPGR